MTTESIVIKILETGARTVGRNIGALGRTVKKAGSAVFSLQAALLTVGVGFTARAIIQEIAAFEKALVGVQKTSTLNTQELRAFGKEMSRLSTELPFATTELLAVAQAGAQLGVADKDLKLFTSTIAKLGTASNLAGEEAATTLVRILNVTGQSVSEIDNFASALVALGNKFAANEADIAKVATRVGQATTQFKIGAANVAGISTALKAVGGNAELSGSVIGRTFRTIDQVIRKGGQQFRLLQEITGETGKALKTTFETDATGVFLKFVAGLKRSINTTKGITTTLEEFGLKGEEINSILPTLATGYDKLEAAVSLSNKAFKENTALENEFLLFSSTLDSKLIVLRNTVKKLVVELGEAGLLEQLKDVTASLKAFAQSEDAKILVDELGASFGVLLTSTKSALVGLRDLFTAFRLVNENLISVRLQTALFNQELGLSNLKAQRDGLKELEAAVNGLDNSLLGFAKKGALDFFGIDPAAQVKEAKENILALESAITRDQKVIDGYIKTLDGLQGVSEKVFGETATAKAATFFDAQVKAFEEAKNKIVEVKESAAASGVEIENLRDTLLKGNAGNAFSQELAALNALAEKATRAGVETKIIDSAFNVFAENLRSKTVPELEALKKSLDALPVSFNNLLAGNALGNALEAAKVGEQAKELAGFRKELAATSKELTALGKAKSGDIGRQRGNVERRQTQDRKQEQSRRLKDEREFFRGSQELVDFDFERKTALLVEQKDRLIADGKDRFIIEEQFQSNITALVQEQADASATIFDSQQARQTVAADGFFSSVGAGFERFVNDADTVNKIVEVGTLRTIDNVRGGISDSIFNLVQGVGSFKETIEGFFTGIVSSFVRLIADLAAQELLLAGLKLFKGFFSSGGVVPAGEDGVAFVRSGEGILTPGGVARLGGKSALEALNKGAAGGAIDAVSELGPSAGEIAGSEAITATGELTASEIGVIASDLAGGAAAGLIGSKLGNLLIGEGSTKSDVLAGTLGAAGFAFGGIIGAGVGSLLGTLFGGIGGPRLNAGERLAAKTFKSLNEGRTFDETVALTALARPNVGFDSLGDAIDAKTKFDVPDDASNFIRLSFFRGLTDLLGGADFSSDELVAGLKRNKGRNAIFADAKTEGISIERDFPALLPVLKELDITKFATGGIASRPTLGLVGESGPEAIIPLENGAVPVKLNQAEVVGLLADIRDNQEAGQSITINIDGALLGEALVRQSRNGFPVVHENGVLTGA